MDFYQLTLLALNITCLALFLYISIIFAKSYMKTSIRSLGFFSLSFMFLALSQVISIASIILKEPRISLTLYTLSSSTASAAFLVMLFLIVHVSREEVFTIIPPLMLISLPDLLAFTLSLLVSFLVKGSYLKRYLIILSITYFLRGLGSLLILSQLGMYLFITSELLKAITTLLFAIYHLSKVTKL